MSEQERKKDSYPKIKRIRKRKTENENKRYTHTHLNASRCEFVCVAYAFFAIVSRWELSLYFGYDSDKCMHVSPTSSNGSRFLLLCYHSPFPISNLPFLYILLVLVAGCCCSVIFVLSRVHIVVIIKISYILYTNVIIIKTTQIPIQTYAESHQHNMYTHTTATVHQMAKIGSASELG